MTRRDDRHALQRFVAGLDVEPEALGTAIAADAIDHAVVEQALLGALTGDEAIVRVRAARRVARMEEAPPRVLAQLRVIAGTDDDPRARAAAEAALAAHEESPAAEPAARRRSPLAIFQLKLLAVRGDGRRYAFGPLVVGDLLETGATLAHTEDGPILELRALPERCRGRRPLLVAEGEEVGRAVSVVSPDGSARIAFPGWTGSLVELGDLLEGAELMVADDG